MCMQRTIKWRQLWQGLLHHLLPLALDRRCCGEVARARLQRHTTFGLGDRSNTAPLRPHRLHTVLHPCCIMLQRSVAHWARAKRFRCGRLGCEFLFPPLLPRPRAACVPPCTTELKKVVSCSSVTGHLTAQNPPARGPTPLLQSGSNVPSPLPAAGVVARGGCLDTILQPGGSRHSEAGEHTRNPGCGREREAWAAVGWWRRAWDGERPNGR